MRLTVLLAAGISMVAGAAFADLSVRFIEGAPKDRFVISSASGGCSMAPLSITVDLAGSAGGLIFDVTEQGAGVEVFQPFELVAGADLVLGNPVVSDGDRSVTLQLASLPANAEVAFTIDVDDTINARQITVTDSEIKGARLLMTSDTSDAEAVFENDAAARMDWSCS